MFFEIEKITFKDNSHRTASIIFRPLSMHNNDLLMEMACQTKF